MKNKLLLFPVLFLILTGCKNTSDVNFNGETRLIPSKDGIELKADYYKTECNNKPLVILFHQAGYSRGEYREIAPKINELGFCCLAIDQRSGKKVNGILNESYKQAKNKNLKTEYLDALPDLRAAIDYVLVKNYARNIILVGSSYSASLIFILGTEYPEQVKGLVAFSPGEYFKYNDKQISEYASEIKCPIFITSSGTEKDNWENIYNNIKTEKKYYFPDFEGYHGAKSLWTTHNGNEKYWTELKSFLKQY